MIGPRAKLQVVSLSFFSVFFPKIFFFKGQMLTAEARVMSANHMNQL